MMAKSKLEARKRRKSRIRSSVRGTGERPRLTIFRSLKHIYAQVIDDETQRTLASASTMEKAGIDAVAGLPKLEQAKKIGELIAKRCETKGIGKVVFDRNGYKYHGRVQAVASAAREAGLQF
jgi:large subunit ribosomal protein L18